MNNFSINVGFVADSLFGCYVIYVNHRTFNKTLFASSFRVQDMLVTQITFTYFLIYFCVLCRLLDDWHLYIGCLPSYWYFLNGFVYSF